MSYFNALSSTPHAFSTEPENSVLKSDQNARNQSSNQEVSQNQSSNLDELQVEAAKKEENAYEPLPLISDLLLEIFSHLKPAELDQVGQTCQELYSLCQTNWLWKKHIQIDFSDCLSLIPEKEEQTINWRSLYQTELFWKNKSIQFIRKHACASFPRQQRITSAAHPYFLALNDEGRLRAIAYFKKPLNLKDAAGTPQTIAAEEWKVSLLVHSQFVQHATLDGHYPINAAIELKVLSSLTPLQTRRINQLNDQIKSWLKTTAKAEDLDAKVAKALAGHFTPKTAIEGVRGGEGLITPDVKAYFVFFRELPERFKFIQEHGILFNDSENSHLEDV